MKKLLTIMMIAVIAVSVASCNKEERFSDAEEFVTVTYTVATGVATKVSYGDGTLATDLTVQVFRKDAGATADDVVWTMATPDIEKTKLNTSPESWQVKMKLAKSYDYRVAFWAQSTAVPAGAFDITDLSAVAVDYTKFAINNDNLDVFCNYAEITNMQGAFTQDVVLYRPLAQINLIATDYADYVKTVPASAATSLKVAVKIENVPNLLNVITKETSGDADLDLAAAAVVGDVFENTSYYYISMAYVMGNQAEALADGATLVLSNDTQNPLATINVSNMPFRANYKTNILGQMLTGSVTYNVVIEPNFYTPDYEIISNTEELAPGLSINYDTGFYTVSSSEGLQSATTMVPDGGTIILKDGTYNGGAAAMFHKNLTIKAEAQGAIIDGKMTIDGNKTLKVEGITFKNTEPYTVPVSTHQYHNKTATAMLSTYDGSIEATNCEFYPTTADACIRLYGANSAEDHVTVKNCKFYGSMTTELRPLMFQGNLYVENCEFHELDRYVAQAYGTGAFESEITIINNKIDPTPKATTDAGLPEYEFVNMLSVGSGAALQNVTIDIHGNTNLTGGAATFTYACKNMGLISDSITYAPTCDPIVWKTQNELKIN